MSDMRLLKCARNMARWRKATFIRYICSINKTHVLYGVPYNKFGKYSTITGKI